jgi:hypothetical protein
MVDGRAKGCFTGRHHSIEARMKISEAKKKWFETANWHGNGSSFKKGEHHAPSTEFKKGISVSPATQFKKGIQNNPNGGFPKGIIPWNKDKTGVYSEETKNRIRNSLRKADRDFHKVVRECNRMGEWNKKILKNYDYTCQRCLVRGGKLAVHHKKAFVRIVR